MVPPTSWEGTAKCWRCILILIRVVVMAKEMTNRTKIKTNKAQTRNQVKPRPNHRLLQRMWRQTHRQFLPLLRLIKMAVFRNYSILRFLVTDEYTNINRYNFILGKKRSENGVGWAGGCYKNIHLKYVQSICIHLLLSLSHYYIMENKHYAVSFKYVCFCSHNYIVCLVSRFIRKCKHIPWH